MTYDSSPRVMRIHEALDELDDAMVLLSLFEAGVYGALSAGPSTASDLALRLSLVPHRLEAFLNLAANLGVVKKCDGAFELFEGDDQYFVPENPYAAGLPKLNLSKMFGVRGRAAEILRGAAPHQAAGSGGDQGAEARDNFLRSIDSVSKTGADELASLLPDAPVAKVMDLGGGGGTYTHAVLSRFPEAVGLIVDRPDAEPTIRALADERGFGSRVAFAALDFLRDSLPKDNDVVILSNVVHCYGVANNQALVATIAESLAPGGVVAIKDYSVNPDHTEPKGALRFAVTMAVNSEEGAVYSAEEVAEWCDRAGLTVVGRHSMIRSQGSYTVIARR